MIKGITVILHETAQTGTDPFGVPEYEDTATPVENVLVGQPSPQEATEELNLTGKRMQYTLAIPKGDTHDWKDKEVEFFGKRFKTFGEVAEGIEEMLPLYWNKQVKVEAYE